MYVGKKNSQLPGRASLSDSKVSGGKMDFPELWLLILLLHIVALGKTELPLHEDYFCKGNTF